MRHALIPSLLCIATLSLGACSPKRAEPVAPVIETGPTGVAATASPTVPPATSVLLPAPGAAKADAGPGRENKSMTRAEESNAMPMAGQANDHSAPLAPGKGASRP